ncbi:hypothetical protein, partial [Thermogutta sp.]|uniref:hypothetical protein n=1 Tax=Thermogutta sp. TaxID=1962930 RepID=UPI003220169A
MGRGTVRRTYSLYLLLVFFGAAFACQYASGGIIYNGGFESDFSVIPNWSVSLADNGTLQRVTSWQSLADSTKTVSPKEGMYFLLIKSDESPPTDTILWQHVTLSVGDVISGWIAIDANLSVYQYAYSDYAQVRILQNTNELFS